jgi:hypothetical protein
MITASKGLSVAGAWGKLSDLMKTFEPHLRGSNVLWINVRENSPKYQFGLNLTDSGECPKNSALSEQLPPEWITYTPEARF